MQKHQPGCWFLPSLSPEGIAAWSPFLLLKVLGVPRKGQFPPCSPLPCLLLVVQPEGVTWQISVGGPDLAG